MVMKVMRIASRTLYVLVCMISFSGMQLCAFPQAVAALAALRTRAQSLTRLIAQEQAAQSVGKKVTLEIVDPELPHAPVEIMTGGFAVMCVNWNTPGNPHIIISSKLKDEPIPRQSRIILHELAHAWDPHLKSVARLYFKRDDPVEDGFYTSDCPFCYYPHLKDDVQACVAHAESAGNVYLEPLAYEWHADWQSIQWMKKYRPGEARKLQIYKKDLIARGFRRSLSLQYPPLEMIVKWLEAKKP